MSQPSGPELSTLLALGLTFAAILVAGLGLGWLVDTLLDSLPAFTMIGLAVGIVAVCVHGYFQFKRFMKE